MTGEIGLTINLAPGVWRGLRTTSLDSGVITALAFDQRGNYHKMLPSGTPYETAVAIKQQVVGALSPHVSAVLLDAEYGLPGMLSISGRCGLMVAYEKSGYSGDPHQRRTEFYPEWTISKIKRLGASAAKLLVYYHPDAGELADEIEAIVSRTAAECAAAELPLFVEPLAYALDEDTAAFNQQRPQIVQETARRLSAAGATILKLEFPSAGDESEWAAACEGVSKASSVPWVLLSAGVDFETYEKQVQVACQSGASGFLAGRAIWREAVTLPIQERAFFLQSTAVERLAHLTEITIRYGRSWMDFYAQTPNAEGWFLDY